ncbi:MAG: flagellar biosynthesis protein FlgD [Novosphingobium sp.]|uniref:flagellar hook assembly protein FlgD n=1 Tax=Novosphingobium sp. TaxID=1874826 RepID=UPI0017A14267|nr:flagellar biosynthesis protein FlgD [Novosphingobium sp.]
MTITALASGASQPTPPPSRNALGQADFIRLMTTQMQMQDPLEPVDNKEMIAQMAQFSSLAGIDKINSTLEIIALQLDQVMTAQAAASTPPASTDATPTSPA